MWYFRRRSRWRFRHFPAAFIIFLLVGFQMCGGLQSLSVWRSRGNPHQQRRPESFSWTEVARFSRRNYFEQPALPPSAEKDPMAAYDEAAAKFRKLPTETNQTSTSPPPGPSALPNKQSAKGSSANFAEADQVLTTSPAPNDYSKQFPQDNDSKVIINDSKVIMNEASPPSDEAETSPSPSDVGSSPAPNDNKQQSQDSPRNVDANAKKDPRSLYEILGASPTDSRSDLKRKYVALAKQTHPDAIRGSSAIEATHDFSEIAAAYRTLSDPKQRKRYDRYERYH
jgi:hypothetical protein